MEVVKYIVLAIYAIVCIGLIILQKIKITTFGFLVRQED